MALTEPQQLTVDTENINLARTLGPGPKSIFADRSAGFEFSISNLETASGRERHTLRVDHEKIAADPFTAVNRKVSSSVYLVVDAPMSGYDPDELKDIVLGLAGWLTAGSAANLLKVLNMEN